MNLNLQRRDRIALAAAAVAITMFIVVQWGLVPLFQARDRARRQLAASTETLEQVQRLAADIAAARTAGMAARSTSRRPPGFTLFSFLDRLAGQSGLKDRVVYMKPSSTERKQGGGRLSMVEIKLEAVTMEQLLNFLYRIESSPHGVWVQRMSIVRPEKAGGIVATVQAQTVESS